MKKSFVLLLASVLCATTYATTPPPTPKTKRVAKITAVPKQTAQPRQTTTTQKPWQGVLCPDDKHPHMIDLGLPSGTKWACCNVEASKPTEKGRTFCWGRTKLGDVYDYYHSNLGSGIGGSSLDAATVRWGAPWRMPSMEQCKELHDKCRYEWTARNGVDGGLFIGPSGRAIFMPCAGYFSCDFGWRYDGGGHGYYWSSTAAPSEYEETKDRYAYMLYFYTNRELDWNHSPICPLDRANALFIRPVVGKVAADKQEMKPEAKQETKQEAKPAASAGGGFCPDDKHPHMVDLGLPSGTKWACCNAGASSPLERGGYYAWGEMEKKSSYFQDNYAYYRDGNYVDIGSNISGTSYDVAAAKWGAGWQMPTHEQNLELMEKCRYQMISRNGVNGGLFIGPNGKSIFLPSAGFCSGNNIHDGNRSGNYWSATPNSSDKRCTYSLHFEDQDLVTWTNNGYRCLGLPVRPVAK